MAKVITYQSPRGATIDLTRTQVRSLKRANIWPKDSTGQEYCTVSHGLHYGEPSYTDAQLAELVA